MENDLLYVSLDKYYKDKDKSKYLLKYLKYEKISLRIIDWFVTNYSKKYDTIYDININNDNITLDDGKYSKQFNVFRSYKAQLKSFSKRNFDPFCRRNRIDYMVSSDNVDIKINTTIGQLNFFRWAIDNLVIEYILKYYDGGDIENISEAIIILEIKHQETGNENYLKLKNKLIKNEKIEDNDLEFLINERDIMSTSLVFFLI